MTVGQRRLGEWLAKTGLTGRQAAQLIGLHWAHFSQVINGHRRPGLDLAFAIEDATHIDARDWRKPLSVRPKAPTRVGTIGTRTKSGPARRASKSRVSQELTT